MSRKQSKQSKGAIKWPRSLEYESENKTQKSGTSLQNDDWKKKYLDEKKTHAASNCKWKKKLDGKREELDRKREELDRHKLFSTARVREEMLLEQIDKERKVMNKEIKKLQYRVAYLQNPDLMEKYDTLSDAIEALEELLPEIHPELPYDKQESVQQRIFKLGSFVGEYIELNMYCIECMSVNPHRSLYPADEKSQQILERGYQERISIIQEAKIQEAARKWVVEDYEED